MVSNEDMLNNFKTMMVIVAIIILILIIALFYQQSQFTQLQNICATVSEVKNGIR